MLDISLIKIKNPFLYKKTLNEKHFIYIAQQLALYFKLGDTIILSGDFGVGKTTFIRAAIRLMTKNSSLEVLSPSFNLIYNYKMLKHNIHHIDLYRLNNDLDIQELMIEELLDNGIVFIEWAERFNYLYSKGALCILIREIKNSTVIYLQSSNKCWKYRLKNFISLLKNSL